MIVQCFLYYVLDSLCVVFLDFASCSGVDVLVLWMGGEQIWAAIIFCRSRKQYEIEEKCLEKDPISNVVSLLSSL